MKKTKEMAQPAPSSFGSFGIALKSAITKNRVTLAIAALTNNIIRKTNSDWLAAEGACTRGADSKPGLWTSKEESGAKEKCHTGPLLCKKYAMMKNGYAKVRDASFTYLMTFIDKGSTDSPAIREAFFSISQMLEPIHKMVCAMLTPDHAQRTDHKGMPL